MRPHKPAPRDPEITDDFRLASLLRRFFSPLHSSLDQEENAFMSALSSGDILEAVHDDGFLPPLEGPLLRCSPRRSCPPKDLLRFECAVSLLRPRIDPFYRLS